MNENLDLSLVLKDCLEGTKFWSPMLGDVLFIKLTSISVVVTTDVDISSDKLFFFDFKGILKFDNLRSAECMLFPSESNRDWRAFRKFNPNTLKPFDRMLVKTHSEWDIELFGYYDKESKTISGINEDYTCYAIPFNEDTEHLLGTSEDCDEHYKWWEE